ncbi:MAG: inositol monophosphatase family protein [Acidimicrobiales bacterium]
MADLDALLALAERVASAGAEHLRTWMHHADLAVSSKDTPTDLVTDVDRSCETLVVDLLTSARPDDGLVAEEGSSIVGRSGVEWVVDPLDGTTNFVYGHPGFSVSIAAVVDGRPSVGVVADPLSGDLFSARAGGGATRNGTVLGLGTPPDLAHALVATGFSYDAGQRRHQAEVLTTVLPRIRDIRRMGGAALDLCSVACGRVDAYYERGLQPWDMAAGWVIAAEAGARVGDLDGGAPSATCCLAAHPVLFDALAALLVTADPPQR